MLMASVPTKGGGSKGVHGGWTSPGRRAVIPPRWGSLLPLDVCTLWESYFHYCAISPSRSKTCLIFSNAALMLPSGNLICPSPTILLNSVQPSSRRTIALSNPSRLWKRPTSWITFSRAWREPSVVSSSPVINRNATVAVSITSRSRSVVGLPALETRLYSSTSRPRRSTRKIFSSIHMGEWPWPMKIMFPRDVSCCRRCCRRDPCDLTCLVSSANFPMVSIVFWITCTWHRNGMCGGVQIPWYTARLSLLWTCRGLKDRSTWDSVGTDRLCISSLRSTRRRDSTPSVKISTMDRTLRWC